MTMYGFGAAKVILLDIEGTTTSISFVKDELFPYITENIKQYLEKHFDEEQCQDDIKALRSLAEADRAEKTDVPAIAPSSADKDEVIGSAVSNVRWQMTRDRKSTALKQLQGHMWRDAYVTGKVKGHLYADVLPSIKRWKEEGKKVYIYSSGSIAAQKLLFQYSVEGDLLEYLDGHFDTTTGPKVEADSYGKIAEALDAKPADVLFLTDVTREAKPAREAGLRAVISVRPGNAPLVEEDRKDFTTISSFEELLSEAKNVKVSQKRKDSDSDDTSPLKKQKIS